MIRRLGLVGFGSIGQALAVHLQSSQANGCVLSAVCVRRRQIAEVGQFLPSDTVITESLDRLLECKLDLVIEAAGQSAVAEYAERVLQSGLELFVLSIGALADPDLRRRIQRAASTNGGSVSVPAGALAGLDGLRSMRYSGLTSVTYTSTKPPSAWLGTRAEQNFSLGDISKRTVLFRGNAADAALNYPKNANLAAAVALAGVGFEATEVELIADPSAVDNTGTIVAESAAATLQIRMSSRAFDNNPKTSEITASSVIAAIDNRSASIRFV
jgi:aspartate dehydrogenase